MLKSDHNEFEMYELFRVIFNLIFMLKNNEVLISERVCHVLINNMFNLTETRRVLSETKAIIFPPYVTGWNQFFCRGR